MDHIVQNIQELKTRIPAHVKIVAVSKTKSVEEIRKAMSAGQILFGENKVQELSLKQQSIPGAEWHFIGHLQTNKVKYMAPFINMIHSVDSFRLLEEVNRQAQKNNRIIDCLLQIHIAKEETKFGLDETEALDLLNNSAVHKLVHVRIRGLMGMATFTDDTQLIRREFRGLAGFFKQVKKEYFPDENSFNELSMGMSDDYPIAIEEGSTMVRIGSLIFGERMYH